jgi:hypothetical protein
MSNRIYDIGHVIHDTDTIAFAMGYAWLLLILNDLSHHPLSDGARDPAGIFSRKKQLLPVVLGLLER